MTKSTPLPFILTAIVAGSVSALLTMGLISPPSPPLPAVNSGTAQTSEVPDKTKIIAAIASLTASHEVIRDRLTALEIKPAQEARTPLKGFVSKDDLEHLERSLEDLLSSNGLSKESDIKTHVADSLNQIRHEEKVAKAWKNHENWSGRIDERVTWVSNWLELDDYQDGELRTAILNKDERNEDVIRILADGGHDEAIAIAKQGNEAQFVEDLEQFLSETQLETWRSKFNGE